MVEFGVMQNFLIALALGALVGLEREYARYKLRGHSYAGIRTYPLIALFGALSAYLGETISVWLLIIAMLIIGLLIVVAYFVVNEQSRKYVGATSEVAGFITFFLGILAYYDQILLATTLAVIMTIILYARSVLHGFARTMTKKELTDTLKFVVIAFVILPFLPNKEYGPFAIFNPYLIWLMVVFISGISFSGYIALKWLGEKGVALAGILGGIAGSTATTTSFAERSKREQKLFGVLALGVILANGVMFVRVLVEVFVIHQQLFWLLLPALGILIAATIGFSYFLWKRAKETKGKVHLTSPFSLTPALKFAGLFTIILALIKVVSLYFPVNGVYLVSFLSGLVDVDVVVLSLAQLAKTTLPLDIAHDGIIIATLTNILAKGGIAYWLGGRAFSKVVWGVFTILLLLGIILLFIF